MIFKFDALLYNAKVLRLCLSIFTLQERVQKYRFPSFRRKPESSFFKQLQTIWTPVFTGVTSFYEFIKLDYGYRIDLLVNDTIIVELKSVDKILPIHQAQLLTYMKLSGISIGLLINFNVKYLKDGIKRMVL